MRWLANTWGEDTFRDTADEPSVTEFDDQALLVWAASSAYQITAAVYDDTGVISTGTIVWPDGSAGTWTTLSKNTGCNTYDAFVLTHTNTGATVTQNVVTRDGYCNVISKPQLVVSGYTYGGSSSATLALGTWVDAPTVAYVTANVITSEFISLALDINGDPGVFVRDAGSSAAHDGETVLVDGGGTRFVRRTHT